MTALFDEPLRVTLKPDLYPVDTESPVGLLLGVVVGGERRDTLESRHSSPTMWGMVCLADGSVELIPSYGFTIDWRYEVETDKFRDLSVLNQEQES